MPFGTCGGCGRFFVIAHEKAPRRSCPYCHQLLRVTLRAEALIHLAEVLAHPGPPQDLFWSHPATTRQRAGFLVHRAPKDRLLSSSTAAAQKAKFLVQWGQEVIDEATSLHHQVAAQLLEARELRGRLGQTLRDVRVALARPELASLLPPEAPPPQARQTSEPSLARNRETFPDVERETITLAVTTAMGLANDYSVLVADLRAAEADAKAGAAAADKLFRMYRSISENAAACR